MITRENHLKQIRPFMDKDIIKVLTGIRRCGKSTLLKQIVEEIKSNGVKEENIILINLESRENIKIKNIDQLDELIEKSIKNKSEKNYLLFDEIQEVENWERLINAYLSEGKYDIYITGSNSNMLSGELATYIAGRYIEIKIFPFSFKEFIEYKKESHSKRSSREITYDLFNEYIYYGAMPFSLTIDKEFKLEYLTDIYRAIILKDIIERNQVRNVELLNRIIMFLMANVSRLFSANSIVKYLKKEKINISVNTIYNYLSYIEDANLINKVKREELIGKKILNHSEKYYLTDLGFRQAIYGSNDRDKGQVLENIIYLELVRRRYNVTIGNIKSKEIDFVCKKKGETIYIQVTYMLAEESTIKREFAPLIDIKDNDPKYVISMDEFDMSREGIKHINAIDFLMEEIEL
jgi:predicted AAA+ superfamily ATPase